MPDWDKDSSQLRTNLKQILEELVRNADRRDLPSLEMARRWHALTMEGLEVPNPRYVGTFRGQPGLEVVQVRVGLHDGVAPVDVANENARFQKKLQALVAELDAALPVGHEPDADEQAAIVDLCAWAHAEWVRIHPFANGNGRTARLWANSLALRYGLPPFVRLRPRPDTAYGDAGANAMQGDWHPTAIVFQRLLDDFLAAIKDQ